MFAHFFAWVLLLVKPCLSALDLAKRAVHINRVKLEPAVLTQCELPPGSTWTKVSVSGIRQPFSMAVYERNDIVSDSLRNQHAWEHVSVNSYGPPGHAYDIGGNVGFYTFALAKAGWKVTTFEPLPSNLALIRATLCANPDIADQIDVHDFALGSAPDHCQIVSDNNNVGDGNILCGKPVPQGYTARGKFEVKRLDDVAPTMKFAKQHVDFVKIDVEGFECKVFEGAQSLLVQKPRLIQSEVWENMQGCTSKEYLQLFANSHYQVKSDVNCQNDASMAGPKGIADYWMCSTGQPIVGKSQTEDSFAGLVQTASTIHTVERSAPSQARRIMLLQLVSPEK